MKQSELWNEIFRLQTRIRELEAEVKTVEAATMERISKMLENLARSGLYVPPIDVSRAITGETGIATVKETST